MHPRLSLILIGIAARVAHAEVVVDWARGMVTAEGTGIADRHAPNPAVARGTSRRSAEDAARAQLAKGLGVLPVATGGTVSDKAKDPAIKARLDRAVGQAIAVVAQPETDGAWRVTMAVPIEAIRQAIETGPRGVPSTGDGDVPVVVIVDGATTKPAIRQSPTLWVKDVPAWAKDAPHVSGTANSPATLYIVKQ